MRRAERPPLVSEEIGFLTCILAEPDDLTACQVYSDWLQDRTDPRGPYMAMTIQRAITTASIQALRNPHSLKTQDKYAKLLAESNRLIEECVGMVGPAIQAWLDWSGVLADEIAEWTKRRAVAGQRPWDRYTFKNGVLVDVWLRDGVKAEPDERKFLHDFKSVIRARMTGDWTLPEKK